MDKTEETRSERSGHELRARNAPRRSGSSRRRQEWLRCHRVWPGSPSLVFLPLRRIPIWLLALPIAISLPLGWRVRNKLCQPGSFRNGANASSCRGGSSALPHALLPVSASARCRPRQALRVALEQRHRAGHRAARELLRGRRQPLKYASSTSSTMSSWRCDPARARARNLRAPRGARAIEGHGAIDERLRAGRAVVDGFGRDADGLVEVALFDVLFAKSCRSVRYGRTVAHDGPADSGR